MSEGTVAIIRKEISLVLRQSSNRNCGKDGESYGKSGNARQNPPGQTRWPRQTATSRSSLQLRSCSSRISGGGLTASMRLTRHRPGSAPFPRCRRDLAQEMTVEPIVPSARSRLRPRSSSSTTGTGGNMASKSQTRSQSTIVPPLGNGGGAASAEGASLAGMSSRQKAWRDILKMLNFYLLKPRVLVSCSIVAQRAW